MGDKPQAGGGDPRPQLLPHTVLIQTGLLDTCEAGVYLTPVVRSMLHVNVGDYLELRHPGHGTAITRRLRELHLSEPVPDVYVYIDPVSAHYLCVAPYEQLEIRRATLDFDAP